MNSPLNEPETRIQNSNIMTTMNKVITLILLFYTGYCFYGYFSMHQAMDSELLPIYATSFAFGFDLAINGLVATCGLILSLIFQWIKFTKISISCLLITMGSIVVLHLLK